MRQPDEPIRSFMPGPVHVTGPVREAMTAPVVPHRSACFRDIYARLTAGLAEVFRTGRDVPFATGSATLVMEIGVVSLVPRRQLAVTNGAFSERWAAIGEAVGKGVDRLEVPWGRPVDPELLRRALVRAVGEGGRDAYDAVTLVHCETSTGVLNPVEELARVVREESDALVLVDAVSSLGGAPVETDAWGLDFVLTGSQKALAAPPGLVPFAVSPRAEERAAAVPVRGFYTDLLRYLRYHRERGGPITTPAIPVAYALERQLEVIRAEGLEARWARHAALRDRVVDWVATGGGGERGVTLAVAAEDAAARSPTVTCLRPPDDVEAPWLVERLARDGVTLGPGYGRWKASTFRIGHLGEVRQDDLDALFELLEGALDEARGAA